MIKSPSVLIVDDDQDKSEVLSDMLRAYGYTKLTICNTLNSALDAIAKQRFDVAVIDGDLGDRNFGSSGQSSQIIKELPENTRLVRFTATPAYIPQSLKGELCTSDHVVINEWLLKQFPVE